MIPFKSLLTGYLASSLFLFACPRLIHSVKRNNFIDSHMKNGKILRIAHRGGAHISPENTLNAFEKCKDVSDMFELDVCQTKDGRLVVFHDKDLKRCCGIQGKVSDFNFDQLPRLNQQINLDFGTEGQKLATKRQKIPLLQQLFDSFPEMAMDIELKAPTQKGLQSLIKLVKKYDRVNRTILGVRNRKLQLNLLKQNQFQVFFSDFTIQKVIFAYFTGLLPFLPIKQSSLQIPLYTDNFYTWKKRQWNDNRKTQLFFGAMKICNILFRPLLWHLKHRGIVTLYWVCNNQQEFQRAIRCGATGIMTDNPPLLDTFLRKYFGQEKYKQLYKNQ